MEGQTAEQVTAARKKLKKVKRKNFFECVVDPHSYSKTIENLFHFSFLIRNGR